MKKILIIEDNVDLCEIFKTVFGSNGFIVEISNDGFQGIMKAVEFNPDIILLDIMMPNMNGVEFLKTFKKNTSMDVPIIVLSNATDPELIKGVLENGARTALLKSEYAGKALVEKIKTYLP